MQCEKQTINKWLPDDLMGLSKNQKHAEQVNMYQLSLWASGQAEPVILHSVLDGGLKLP